MASVFENTNSYSTSLNRVERKLEANLALNDDSKEGVDYCEGPNVGKPWCCCYDLGNDWYGPQFFFPTQCIRQTSFMIPRVASPQIAIIGKQNELNYIEQDISDYFVAFKKIQRATPAWLIVPSYRTKYFDTQQDMFDYVSNEEYLTDFAYQGLCMGLDVEIKGDKGHQVEMKVYFNDQSYGAGPLAYGVPD